MRFAEARDQLSHGVSFDSSEQIRQRQLYSAATAWIKGEIAAHDFNPARVVRGDLHGWFERLIVTANVTYTEQMVETIRDERDRIHDSIKEHFDSIDRSNPVGFNDYLEREGIAMSKAMLCAYRDWIERNREVASGIRPFSLDEVLPPPAVTRINLIAQAFRENGVAAKEVYVKAAEFLESGAYQLVPFQRIASSLWAVISMKAAAGQKEPPNRGTVNDISFVSTLMPYCDVMLVDDKCFALIDDIPAKHALGYPALLFSTRTRDRFIEYLEGLERNADPRFLAEVQGVYGEGSLTPFLTMYEVERERMEGRRADI